MKKIRIPTSAKVYCAIREQHPELMPFGGFSDPDGTLIATSTGQARMETTWGFPETDLPILETKISWDARPDKFAVRENEKAEYWLLIYDDEGE